MTRSILHRFVLFVLLVTSASALAACRYLEEVLPTPRPAAVPAQPETTISPADESPRLGNSLEIPPTWTPSNDQSNSDATPIAPEESSPGATEQASYVVQPGDTLAEIAQRYNVTVEELARVNDIDDLDHIEAGQVLIIPGF